MTLENEVNILRHRYNHMKNHSIEEIEFKQPQEERLGQAETNTLNAKDMIIRSID